MIRHAMTRGNQELRYIGRTEESLCSKGLKELEKMRHIYPEADRLYVSPMQRCIQTAEVIYPGKEQWPVEEFREIDFGEFEGKNYRELNGNPRYQHWIDCGGVTSFPGGESHTDFINRCSAGLYKAIAECRNLPEKAVIVLVVHGGTIMALLDRFQKIGSYFDYRCDNGHGYICDLEIHGNEILLKQKGVI